MKTVVVNNKGKSKWDSLLEKFIPQPIENPDLFSCFKGKLPVINDIKVTVRNFFTNMKTFFLYGEKNLNEFGVDNDIVNRFKQIRFDSDYKLSENPNASACIKYTVEPEQKFSSFEEWKKALGKELEKKEQVKVVEVKAPINPYEHFERTFLKTI